MDLAENGINVHGANKPYEVAPIMSLTGHEADNSVVWVSDKAWKGRFVMLLYWPPGAVLLCSGAHGRTGHSAPVLEEPRQPTQCSASRNINSVHIGVVLIVTLAFGLITPPNGLALLMASKSVGTRFSTAFRASLPIYLVFFAVIAFTIFVPDAVLQGAGGDGLHLSLMRDCSRMHHGGHPTRLCCASMPTKPRREAPRGASDSPWHILEQSLRAQPC